MLTREELVPGLVCFHQGFPDITRTILAVGETLVFYKWTSESGGAGESTMEIDPFLENNAKVKPRIRGWMNIYRGTNKFYIGSCLYPTAEEAAEKTTAISHRIACIYIDGEEGEGLTASVA